MSAGLYAQIDGDNIFGENQIITIELNFSQANYFDVLAQNYETSTYIEADLVLTDNTGTYEFEEVGVRYKGNSSYNHPGNKKAFKIDFNRFVSSQNYDGLKKLNFSNGFKDPSVIREKIFFDVSQEAGVPTPRASFANVYFNGELLGFYTVIEQIDDQFLDWRILDDDGNLFKAGDNFGGGPGGGGDAADLVYYGDDQAAYEAKYELKSNEEENDWTDLIELIDFINNSSSQELEEELANHLELQEYLRSAALDNLFGNFDSYTGSARNYYIYHNLTTDKWEWIKWDGNEAFGSYPAGGGGGPGGGGGQNPIQIEPDYSDPDRPLLDAIFDTPALYDQYMAHYCDLLALYFNSEYIDAHIDEIKELVQDAVYADDNKMYSNADFDTNVESDISGGGPGPGGGGTTYGLKSFVAERAAFLNNLIDCSQYELPEDTTTTSLERWEIKGMKIFPNPAAQATTIEWEGEVAQIQLINVLGEIVLSENTQSKNNLSLEVAELKSGLYFIQLATTDGTLTQPLMIMNE